MEKGFWPYATPLGYKNLKPKHRAYEHEYVITEQGKLIIWAYQLKIRGELTNKEICVKLAAKGLKLNEKSFRWVLSNPFYAGYVTGNLVKGRLIKGEHPALVDISTYMKANDLLAKAPNVGIAKKLKQEDLPLKIFAKDEMTGSPFSGYIKKGNWYYKSKVGGVNINAKRLNKYFQDHLKNFEYKKEHKPRLKKLLIEAFKRRLASQFEETIQLKKRITELENQIEKIEERYILGDIQKELYSKYTSKYQSQLQELRSDLEKKSFDSSTLEIAVGKVLALAENLSRVWVSGDFDEKRKLQYLVFPEGTVYNKKNDAVRTIRTNSLFAEIPPLKSVLKKNKKGNLEESCPLPAFVPHIGELSNQYKEELQLLFRIKPLLKGIKL